MKRTTFLLLAVIIVFCTSCDKYNNGDSEKCSDYRQAMRDFVIRISEAARAKDNDFIVIPQNGMGLITLEDDPDGELATSYLAAIDGHGQEDLFYGYPDDEMATPAAETRYLLHYLRRSREQGNSIFVIDYCAQPNHVADSYARCDAEGFVAFPAHRRNLDRIPTNGIHHENSDRISKLNEVQNFLYLINPENFASHQDFIHAVCATNYDMIVMDLFFNDGTPFTAAEVEQLRRKQNGGTRLVICYMSIGEAEDYRYYWQKQWKRNRPEWLGKENRDWPGNYKVKYWYSAWQELICGNDNNSYLGKILAAGFDGVYLDLVDAYEYFEK